MHPALSSQLHALAPARPHGSLALAPAIDAALGGGLALGALHEIDAEGLDSQFATLAAGFLARLLAALPDPRPILWIARIADLYPPGLRAYGLDPARLILAQAADDAAVLAGMETALRGGAMAAVVGEAGRLGRLSGRRLQLACLRHGSTGFLLRRHPHGRTTAGADSFAVSRWRIAAATSQAAYGEPGPPRWRLDLLAARGGTEGSWTVEPTGGPHDHPQPHPLRVVPGLADPAAARRRA